MGRLTDLQALTLTRPGLHGDGATLYLRVSPRGTKSWIQRISIRGRRHDLGLGPFPRVSLVEARHHAMGNRLRVWQGHDIFIERKRRKHVPTFEEATRRVYELNRPRWSNESHAQGWIQTLQRHAFPVLATLRVDSIKQHDVLRVLEPIWTKRPETARRVRQRVRTIPGWCPAYGYMTENVAGPCIDAALPRVPSSQRHYRALPYCEVGAALVAVVASPVTQVVSLCLRFVVSTARRGSKTSCVLMRTLLPAVREGVSYSCFFSLFFRVGSGPYLLFFFSPKFPPPGASAAAKRVFALLSADFTRKLTLISGEIYHPGVLRRG